MSIKKIIEWLDLIAVKEILQIQIADSKKPEQGISSGHPNC